MRIKSLTTAFAGILIVASAVVSPYCGSVSMAEEVSKEGLAITSKAVVEDSTVQNDVGSGTFGEGFTWTLDNEGTLTISGEGYMKMEASGPEWDSQAVKKVILQNGIQPLMNTSSKIIQI